MAHLRRNYVKTNFRWCPRQLKNAPKQTADIPRQENFRITLNDSQIMFEGVQEELNRAIRADRIRALNPITVAEADLAQEQAEQRAELRINHPELIVHLRGLKIDDHSEKEGQPETRE